MKIKIPDRIKTVLFPLRYLLALVPFAWIFRKVNLAEFENVYRNTAWWTIPWVLSSAFMVIFLNGVRWWILLRKFAPTLPFSQALKTHFISAYYSVILPTSFAQDATRIFLTSKHVDYSIVWGAAWIYKLIYFFTWTIISTYGILTLNKELLPKGSYMAVFLLIAILALLVYLSFSKRTTAPLRVLLNKFLPKKIMGVFENIRQGIYNYRDNKRDLYYAIFLTIFIQMIFIFGTSFVLYGITGNFHLIECFAFLPVIDILCMLFPLTPNSVGIREIFYAYMFTMIGRSEEELGVFISIGLLGYFLKLVGGIPLLVDLFKGKPVSSKKN